MINVAYFDSEGAPSRRDIRSTCFQDDDPKPEGKPFATWMPYQKAIAEGRNRADAARLTEEVRHLRRSMGSRTPARCATAYPALGGFRAKSKKGNHTNVLQLVTDRNHAHGLDFCARRRRRLFGEPADDPQPDRRGQQSEPERRTRDLLADHDCVWQSSATKPPARRPTAPGASSTATCRATERWCWILTKPHNPPCSFTPYATCPLPPPENRLAVRIEAGEKKYGH